MTTEYRPAPGKTMKTYQDIPEIYKARLVRMYRKNAKLVLSCPNVMKLNHLLKPCMVCSTEALKRHAWEKTISFELPSRVYRIHADVWEKFALKALVKSGMQLYTNLEFPAPRVVYRGETRTPMFYEPSTDTLIDCFPTEEEANKYSKYFLNKMYKVCSSVGLYYHQVVIDKTGKIKTLSRQPRPELDEEDLIHKLLTVLTKKK